MLLRQMLAEHAKLFIQYFCRGENPLTFNFVFCSHFYFSFCFVDNYAEHFCHIR